LKALIVVDMQRDFMPGGALPVPGADEIIGTCNRLIEAFSGRNLPVVLTRDWHPENHVSFKVWPRHCVRGTEGAEFVVRVPEGAVIVSKATEPDKEAYSAFQGTDLEERLRRMGVSELYVCGVATEYCVKATVLDALRLGFRVYVVKDAVRGISEEGERRALEEMKEEGAAVVKAADLLSGL